MIMRPTSYRFSDFQVKLMNRMSRGGDCELFFFSELKCFIFGHNEQWKSWATVFFNNDVRNNSTSSVYNGFIAL